MELGKLLQSSRLDQSPVRHDTKSLKMRRPVLAEVDVLNITAFRHNAIQRAVIDPQIFLIEFRL